MNNETQAKKLKLDIPKTAKVGIAFAIICLFWSTYDFVIPLLLENAYGLSNTWRGIIMGLDNLLALFMLPLFGKISDKASGKLVDRFGKRTPFIVLGTVLAAMCMIFVPLTAKQQGVRSNQLRQDYLLEISQNPEVLSERLNSFYDDSRYNDIEYLKNNNISKEHYVNIKYNHIEKNGIFKKTYTYNGNPITQEEYNALSKENGDYNKFVASGMKVWISEQVNEQVLSTKIGRNSLISYMVILFICLLAMATFRSPAVALMPDVTPKPLRSPANAIINLAGGVGSALAFVIYTVVLWQNNPNNYVIIFSTVAGTMLLLLTLFLLLVKENKLLKENQQLCLEYGLVDEQEEEKPSQNIKIRYKDRSPEEKAKFKSFILILASIFMWFMGYNAVSSAMSVYCTKALNLPASVASVVSGVSMAVSAIAFIPVGFLATKIGRRKSIMIGFGLAVLSYVLLLLFVRQSVNYMVPAVLFSTFYLIAGFGLIIANVNTFPMVVELSRAEEVGKYTGLYYTATMSAQAITPMLSGLVMDAFNMRYLFAYSAVAVAIAIVLMFFVKHGDSKPIPKGKKLTAEEKKAIMLESMGDAD
ncbi:MAG: SLC45 family MFS transporter [Clostridiales bacterium]|nr:SLC45 family MFS transporter [Clostridiales bacterium]